MALNINEQTRKEANLRLLQRSMDRSISDILGSATHVVLYHFHQSSQSWEKSKVEGSLFLAIRPSGYLLVILNRNSPDNYPIELSPGFQVQHSDPYLIFRHKLPDGEMSIRGIWFPNPDERIKMNDLLNQVSNALKQQPPKPPPAPVPAPAPSLPPTVATADATAALLSSLSIGVNSNTSSQSNTTPVRQASPSSGNQQPTLDKKSLQLALLSLIQDDRFLDLLHAQYLKVAHARANRNHGGS